MGLCLGFSFLSFIEVIYWLTCRVARNVRNWRHIRGFRGFLRLGGWGYKNHHQKTSLLKLKPNWRHFTLRMSATAGLPQ